MAFKFVTLFALFAMAAAGPLDYHQQGYQHDYQPAQNHHHEYQPAPVVVKKIAVPTYAKQQQEQQHEYEGPSEYDFNYAVNDENTGDIKSQQESRKGENVVGQYTLIDADGYRRIVDYTSDDHNGFQATVRREPVDGYKQPIAQKYVQAPVAQKYVAAPVEAHKYEEAPVHKYVQAPVQKYVSAPAPVAQKYVHQAPVLNYVQAPVAQKYVAESPKYSAPITKIVKKVPIAKYVAPIAKYVAPIHVSKYAQPSSKYVAAHQTSAASPAQYEAYHKAQYEEAAPVHNYHY